MKELEIDNYYLVIIDGKEYIFKYVGGNKWHDQLFGLVPESLTKNAHIAGRMTLSADLQAQNDELRAKLELMTRLGSYMADELQANYNNQQTRLMSMKWYKTVDSSNAQSLADIRAEAVMSIMDKAHSCETPNGDIAYSSELIHEYANKIKGAE